MRKQLDRLFSLRALLPGVPAALLALTLCVVVVRNVTTPPTSISNDPREPRDLLVHINGTDEPIVEVSMAEGAPLVLEFPAADELYAAHVGYTGVAEISNRVGAEEHQLVLHAGFDFPTAKRRRAAEAAVAGEPVSLDDAWPETSSGYKPDEVPQLLLPQEPEPATTIHVQTRSGAALTLRIYAVESVDAATRRCVVSYDPEEVSRARAKAGLATGLR